MKNKLQQLRKELNNKYKNKRYDVNRLFKHSDAIKHVNLESKKYAKEWRDILFVYPNKAYLIRLIFIDLLILTQQKLKG